MPCTMSYQSNPNPSRTSHITYYMIYTISIEKDDKEMLCFVIIAGLGIGTALADHHLADGMGVVVVVAAGACIAAHAAAVAAAASCDRPASWVPSHVDGVGTAAHAVASHLGLCIAVADTVGAGTAVHHLAVAKLLHHTLVHTVDCSLLLLQALCSLVDYMLLWEGRAMVGPRYLDHPLALVLDQR